MALERKTNIYETRYCIYCRTTYIVNECSKEYHNKRKCRKLDIIGIQIKFVDKFKIFKRNKQ